MELIQYEAEQLPGTFSDTGIFFQFATTSGGYRALHWHESLEILYQLNGESEIMIDGRKYSMPRKQFVVINPRQVHATYCHDPVSMFLYIHLNLEVLQKYMPAYAKYQIFCLPQLVKDEQFPEYLELCRLLESMTRLYLEDKPACDMEARGIILQIYARLLRSFSKKADTDAYEKDRQSMNQIYEVIHFVEQNYRNQIVLDDGADLLGFSREYFCRFFKRNMGISFLRFVNEVRIAHIYEDLVSTDKPVSVIAEENGFLNQKLFHKMFLELYGCRPMEIRKRVYH